MAGKAAAGRVGAAAPGAAKRGREWEEVVAAKSAASQVYKSLFTTKEQRAEQEAADAKNYAARGVPMRVTGGM